MSGGGWALPHFPARGGGPLTREVHLSLVQLIHPLVHGVRHLVQLLPGWGREKEVCEPPGSGVWQGRGLRKTYTHTYTHTHTHTK